MKWAPSKAQRQVALDLPLVAKTWMLVVLCPYWSETQNAALSSKFWFFLFNSCNPSCYLLCYHISQFIFVTQQEKHAWNCMHLTSLITGPQHSHYHSANRSGKCVEPRCNFYLHWRPHYLSTGASLEYFQVSGFRSGHFQMGNFYLVIAFQHILSVLQSSLKFLISYSVIDTFICFACRCNYLLFDVYISFWTVAAQQLWWPGPT